MSETVQNAAGQTLLIAGGPIPDHDHIAMTYVGSTNNVQTVTYKRGGANGATVATLTMTYVGAGVSDDDRVASVTRS